MQTACAQYWKSAAASSPHSSDCGPLLDKPFKACNSDLNYHLTSGPHTSLWLRWVHQQQQQPNSCSWSEFLALVPKDWLDPQAPHWFHPPLPPCGRDDAPHQASWIQNRTGVHAPQRFGELRSVKKWQPEGGREGRMCQQASWMWRSLSLLSLLRLSRLSLKQEGCSLSFDFNFCL